MKDIYPTCSLVVWTHTAQTQYTQTYSIPRYELSHQELTVFFADIKIHFSPPPKKKIHTHTCTLWEEMTSLIFGALCKAVLSHSWHCGLWLHSLNHVTGWGQMWGELHQPVWGQIKPTVCVCVSGVCVMAARASHKTIPIMEWKVSRSNKSLVFCVCVCDGSAGTHTFSVF